MQNSAIRHGRKLVFGTLLTIGIAALAILVQLIGAGGAGAMIDHGTVVGEVPRQNLPVVLDGVVHDHAQVGRRIVVVGDFGQIRLADNSVRNVSNIFAYDINTGEWDSNFVPQVNNIIRDVEAAPDGSAFYIGGKFTQIDGKFRTRAAKFNTDGVLDNQWIPTVDAVVLSIAASPTTVYLGGDFTEINGVTRTRLGAVDTTTAAVDSGFVMNLGSPIQGMNDGDDFPELKTWAVLLTPDFNTLFTAHSGGTVNGQSRPGLAKIDISGATAQLTGWRAPLFADNDCFDFNGDRTYAIRDAAISPDGSFVVVGSGGGDRPPLCDTVIRFDTAGNGNVTPTWIARMYSSVFSVAVSDAAVYASGHFCSAPRNPIPVGGISSDYPGILNGCETGPGAGDRIAPYIEDSDNAVFRNQLAALNPVHGQALPWNPGSNNFTGGFDMTVIERGVLYGGDSDRVNDVLVGRSAFFDLGAPPDTSPPVVTVATPLPGAGAPENLTIAGAAEDDWAITTINIRIRRLADNLFLQSDGTFAPGQHNFSPTQTPTGLGMVDYELQGITLDPDAYRLTVAANDTSFNNTAATVDFTVGGIGNSDCTVVLDGNGRPQLTWTSDPAANSYAVRLDGLFLANVGLAQTFTDNTTPPGFVDYKIRSLPSLTERQCTPTPFEIVGDPDPGPDPIPTTCTATVNGSEVTIDWAPVDGESNFSVRRDGSWIASVSGEFTYTDSNVAPGSHTYVVRFKEAGVNYDGTCSPDPVVIAAGPPPTCTKAAGAGGVDLSWESYPGAKRYVVRKNGVWLQTVLLPTQTYTDVGGSIDDTYVIRYRISGSNLDVTCEVDDDPPDPPEVLADGNTIQLNNVQYAAWLATSGNDVVTSTTSNLNSRWLLIDPEGDGSFALQNLGNGRYLDGDDGGVDTSSSIDPDDLWEFIEINPGQYHIRNFVFDEIIDANGANADVAWDPGGPETDDLWVPTLAP